MNEEENGRVVTVIPAHPVKEARQAARRKALLGVGMVAIFAMLAVIVVTWMSGEDTGLRSVPPLLIGKWTSSNAEYSDRSLAFTSDTISFGTGGTSVLRYSIIGVAAAEENDDEYFVLHFRGADGAKFRREVVMGDSGKSLFFRSQHHVIWTRFEQAGPAGRATPSGGG